MKIGFDRNNAVIGRRETQFDHNPNLKELMTAVLRGGRMTKHKGVAASYSPELGVAIPSDRMVGASGVGAVALSQTLALGVAPAALLMSSTSAIAQDACVEISPNVFECQDNGAPAIDGQVITGDNVRVDIQDGFDVIIPATSPSVRGISVDTTGGASISQSGGASFVSATSYGVRVINSTSGAVSIDASSTQIISGNSGLVVRNNGTGSTSIATTNVTSTGNDGVYANAGLSAGDILVDTTAGAVSGQNTGIEIFHGGTAKVSVTTADVTGELVRGVQVYNLLSGSGGIEIDTSAGSVSGGIQGVFTRSGSINGITNITVNNVTTTGNSAIAARNEAGAGAIQIQGSSGDIQGVDFGIYVNSAGADITVDNHSSVTATDGDALFLLSSGGDIAVSNIGTVSGTGGRGIAADSGGGEISIQAVGLVGGVSANDRPDVFFSAFAGIDADATGVDGGDINIGGTIAIGDVSADLDDLSTGIRAITNGTGDIVIDSSSGTVTANRQGILVFSGEGDVTLTTGNVYSPSFTAIAINNDGGDITLDTRAGSVIGGSFGIDIRDSGAGDISINTADVASTTNAAAVYVSKTYGAGDVSVDASGGTLSGATDGIKITTAGGDILVENLDSVTGQAGDGLDLATAGGAITVRDIGAVSGTDGFGILADSYGGDISIQGVGLSGGVLSQSISPYSNASGAIRADATGGSGGDINIGGVTPIGDVTTDGFSYNPSLQALAGGTGSITIDTSAGTVSGGSNGIEARTYGTGSISITTADVRSADFAGVYARASNGSISIDTTAGTLSDNDTGISARQYGAGDLAVSTADVENLSGTAIRISATGSVILDTTAGSIQSTDSRAISVTNTGTEGTTTVTTGDVTSTSTASTAALSVVAESNRTVVDTTGGVVTGPFGISVTANGAGPHSLTTGDVIATQVAGVSFNGGSNSTDITVDTSAGHIVSAERGVSVSHRGTGTATVTTGDVTGGDSFLGAVYVSAGGTDVAVDTSAGTISGGDLGILVRHSGTGSAHVNVGDVIGMGQYGIRVTDDVAGGTVLVTGNSSDVTGGVHGVQLDGNSGGVDHTVENFATVTGETGSGLRTFNSTSGSINIRDIGTVAGNGGSGIRIDGSSFLGGFSSDLNVSIQGVGLVGGITGATGFGIFIRADQINIGDEVAIGDVSGAIFGVYAASFGNGDVIVDTSGGSVTGGSYGILAGNGILEVDVPVGDINVTTADVSADTGTAIRVVNLEDGANITLDTTAGAIDGATTGIIADNRGVGSTRIATADVSATETGVYAINGENTAGLSIDTSAGTVTAANTYGIAARNRGSGTLSIITADVNSGGVGINARNYADATDLIVDTTAGSVIGPSTGIFASNAGTGMTTIATGDVSSTSGPALRASTIGTDLSIDTSAGTISGGGDAISVTHYGSGSVAVISADVSSYGGGNGISVTNTPDGTSISIDSSAGQVIGNLDGIYARNNGTGDVSVTTADVTGSSSNGIRVRHQGTSGAIAVDSSAGSVSGASQGIYVSNSGTGDTSVTTADVSGSRYEGIRVINLETADSILIDSSLGGVNGGNHGIYVTNNGTGDVSVTTADVTAMDEDGILAESAGGQITIDSRAGSVTANRVGVFAIQNGAAGVSISTGDVTSTTSNAIAVQDTAAGTGIEINSIAGDLIASGTAIDVRHQGTGDIAIATGNVTSTGFGGVYASNQLSGGAISVDTTAGAISSASAGIDVRHGGTGDIAIATGDVTAASFCGIFASNTSDGGSITIDSSAGTLNGDDFGIDARKSGTGDLSIITGDVNATMMDAVSAANYSSGGSVSIDTTAGTLTANLNGIEVSNSGSGDISITAGDILAQTNIGISTRSMERSMQLPPELARFTLAMLISRSRRLMLHQITTWQLPRHWVEARAT